MFFESIFLFVLGYVVGRLVRYGKKIFKHFKIKKLLGTLVGIGAVITIVLFIVDKLNWLTLESFTAEAIAIAYFIFCGFVLIEWGLENSKNPFS